MTEEELVIERDAADWAVLAAQDSVRVAEAHLVECRRRAVEADKNLIAFQLSGSQLSRSSS